jgi:hypothetical protein
LRQQILLGVSKGAISLSASSCRGFGAGSGGFFQRWSARSRPRHPQTYHEPNMAASGSPKATPTHQNHDLRTNGCVQRKHRPMRARDNRPHLLGSDE